MRLARYTLFASAGLFIAVSVGCYRPYVTPYGAPPGYPSAPVQTLTPGGTYTPNAPSGTYGTPSPSDSFSTPTPSDNSTYQSGGSSDQTPYYDRSNSSPSNGGGGVPQPFDPGEEVQFQQNSTPSPIAEDVELDEYGALDGAGASMASVAKVPLENAEFVQPVHSAEQASKAATSEDVTTDAGAQSPFAHDADGFRWLRGVARRNEETGNWSLIYSTVSTDTDPFHGWITLAPDSRLNQLEPNGVYLVHGQVDQTQTDPTGKPLYRVDSITEWQPAPTF